MEIFNADEQRDAEINNLLQRIKYKAKKDNSNTIFLPFFINDRMVISVSDQLYLNELKEWGVIDLTLPTTDKTNKIIEENTKLKKKSLICISYLIKLIEPKFSKLCEEFRHKINGKIEGEEKTAKSNLATELYLNKAGDLWREPKNKYCYKMNEESNRYKIIRYLVINKGYRQTWEISRELGSESEQSIRTEIGKIRHNIKKFLKIDGKQILEAKKGSGYRMGLNYKIKIKKGVLV